MSVETVLDKIITHNSNVMGCVVRSGDRVFSRLPDVYDLMDRDEFSENAASVFELTDGLETDRPPFEQMFLEFESHSIFAKRLDEGVLVLLNKPMERASFKKLQVGVNLFVKPLKRALIAPEEPKAAAGTSEPDPQPKPPNDNGRIRGPRQARF